MKQMNGRTPPARTRANPRYRSRRRRKRRLRIYWPRFGLTLVFLAMVCFGSVQLTKYLLGVRKTAQVNGEVAQIYEDQPRAEIAAPQLTDPPEAAAEAFADDFGAGETAAEPAVTPMEESANEFAAEPAVEFEDGYADGFDDFDEGVFEEELTFHASDGEVMDGFNALHKQNPDLAAWLKLPDVLSLPVVYRDNSYYLDHDFYGRSSDSGTLFLDERHPLEAQSQYLMVHGHAMYDGSMFGYLTHYRDMDYIQKHPYLYLSTKYQEEKYEIIGVLDVSEEEMISIVRLGTPQFVNRAAFTDFVSGLRANALHFTRDEIAADDALLALSTCWKDGRIVVFFKRVE